MANTVYENYFLSNTIEDQFKSHLDLMQFCKIDNELEGVAGMKRKIHVYKATDGTEKLAMGAGNSKSIEVNFTEKEYEILLAQNRFEYYDEQAMKDPTAILTGVQHTATDLFNTMNADVFAEFKKATLTHTAKAPDFDAFVTAVAKLNLENVEGVELFALVNPEHLSRMRSALNENLKYVEAFAKTGYIGTVAGVNIYTKKDADANAIYIATKEAVTLFNKKGTEVEQARDENTRKNSIYSRKYYLAALTDATKVVKLTISARSA